MAGMRQMNQITEFLKKIARPALYIVLLIFFVGMGWMLWETYKADNLGFDGKTLWDWMEPLIIPATLATFGVWFTYVQKKTELETAARAREKDREIAEKERETDREIALERQGQQTLENYLDRMKELLLDRGLGPDAKPEVKRLARTLTLNVLRGLTAQRTSQVVQFLQESKLVDENQVVDLKAANLEGANLAWANLKGVNLEEANLAFANLEFANLGGANLEGVNLFAANLSTVNLEGANLEGANLEGANLQGANLSGANLDFAILEWASLAGAEVTDEQLAEAELSDPHSALDFE